MTNEHDEVTKQGQATVTMSRGTKKETEANTPGSQADPVMIKDFALPQRRFQETNYSKVGLTMGLTKSLGNFEFARMDVYVEDFCEVDKKRETLDAINRAATDYVVKAMIELDAYIKDKKSGAKDTKLGF